MTNPTEIKLPTNLDELRECIRAGIETYQGSPAKKENKLNESLASGLNFSSYDALAPLIESSKPVKTYSLDQNEEHHYRTMINDITINSIVFDEEKANYYLIEREERINDLFQYIGECSSDSHGQLNKSQMTQSLDFLRSIDDDFLFESIHSGLDMVAASDNPKRFNEVCEEILTLHEESKSDLEKLADELVSYSKKKHLLEIFHTGLNNTSVTNVEIDSDFDLAITYDDADNQSGQTTYYVNIHTDSFIQQQNKTYVFTSAEYGKLKVILHK
jgi:hypothetical protein